MKSLYVVEQYLSRHLIGPNRQACLDLLATEQSKFERAPGSSHNHQAWEGGYIDHVAETMRIAGSVFSAMRAIRPGFELSDAILIMFLHDLEKPWKYVDGIKFKTKEDRRLFREEKIKEAGIQLTVEHENALRYVEGEFDDYSPNARVMGPLAAFCHMCDVASARIWFNEPRQDEFR